jgi:hypothetical protein
MKLMRLIEVCIIQTYCKVRVGKCLSEIFPIQNDLKKGDALLSLLFCLGVAFSIRKLQEKACRTDAE